MSTEAIKRAVDIAGSQRILAEGIAKFLNRPSFSQQTVSYWINHDVAIEAEYWPAIEFVTDNGVTREELRPDVFTTA